MSFSKESSQNRYAEDRDSSHRQSGSSESTIEIDMPPTGSSKIFNVYRTTSYTNWTVTLPDKTPLYYIRTSMFRPGRPEITMHAGGYRDGPIVGVSNFVKFSSGSKLGLGDPANPLNMSWEDLTKESSMDHSLYRLDFTFRSHDANEPQRRSFRWKRTHSVGVKSSKPSKFGLMNFKLVDEATGELLAVFANNGLKSFKKQGKFQIHKDYGQDFDAMIILSGMTLLERTCRRNAARSG